MDTPATNGPATIGFVGLGQMGQPMASFIAKGETPMLGYDQVPGQVPDGAEAASNLAELVERSDTIFLSLPDGKVVNTVAAEIATMQNIAGKVVIDLSTSGPAAAITAAKTLTTAGLTYIDAPVSGGRQGALKGTITIIWAGAKAQMERHQPIIDLFCANAFHVGDQPGQGQAVKLLNNFLSATSMAATTEAVLFGLSLGVDMKTILDVVKVSTGNNTAVADKFPNRILTGSYDAGFFAELMNKDVQLYQQFVEKAGTPNKMGRQVAEIWQHVEDSLPPKTDFTRIYEVIEKESKS